MLKKVAVTGGLSCGKSSACRFFKELGAYVVSADEIVHQLLTPNTALGQQVVALIGKDIVIEGKINRNAVAKKVFNNAPLLRSLEQLLHPAVREEIDKQYQQVVQQESAPLFIAEIPLLFETKGERLFDLTVVVVASEKSSKERFSVATGYASDEYAKRAAQQLPIEEKISHADYVIRNDGTLDDLKEEVTKLFDKLTS